MEPYIGQTVRICNNNPFHMLHSTCGEIIQIAETSYFGITYTIQDTNGNVHDHPIEEIEHIEHATPDSPHPDTAQDEHGQGWSIGAPSDPT